MTRRGLIYGMGHAVYSLSDPRAVVFKNFVHQLADAKGRDRDFEYYNTIERLAPQVIAEKRHIYKGVSTNVDFYSGFVYDMLGIPVELYTPIFAVGPHRGLVGPPDGGAGQHGQDHPSRLPEHHGSPGVCAPAGPLTCFLERKQAKNLQRTGPGKGNGKKFTKCNTKQPRRSFCGGAVLDRNYWSIIT